MSNVKQVPKYINDVNVLFNVMTEQTGETNFLGIVCLTNTVCLIIVRCLSCGDPVLVVWTLERFCETSAVLGEVANFNKWSVVLYIHL